MGRSSMKFRGSSASMEPGMDRFTKNSFLTRSRYFESTVKTGKNSIDCGSILVSGVIEPQSSSSLQKLVIPVQQSLKELSTLILMACIMFWLGVSISSTKSGSMQGGKCQFLIGTNPQKSYLFYICFSSYFFSCSYVEMFPKILSISAKEISSESRNILTSLAKLQKRLLWMRGLLNARKGCLLNILIIINKNLYLILINRDLQLLNASVSLICFLFYVFSLDKREYVRISSRSVLQDLFRQLQETNRWINVAVKIYSLSHFFTSCLLGFRLGLFCSCGSFDSGLSSRGLDGRF